MIDEIKLKEFINNKIMSVRLIKDAWYKEQIEAYTSIIDEINVLSSEPDVQVKKSTKRKKQEDDALLENY